MPPFSPLPLSLAELHNMENYFSYTPGQFTMVSGLLTLGYGAFLATLVFSLLTLNGFAPRYRCAGVLSSMVAATAGFILYREANLWQATFSLNEQTQMYVRNPGQLYSNTYRYVNWLITVPLLVTTLAVVVPQNSRDDRRRTGAVMVTSGIAMVVCSWIGAFFETNAHDEGLSTTGFWISYVLGWVFYVVLLATVLKVLAAGARLAPSAGPMLNRLKLLFLTAWTLYAVVLLQPLFWWSADSVVVRQGLFTIADITSKAVYGVMIGQLAIQLARREPNLPDPHAYVDEKHAPDTVTASSGTNVGVPADYATVRPETVAAGAAAGGHAPIVTPPATA